MAHTARPEPRPLVLVVDDEEMLLHLVARILRAEGYEVVLAAHGLAATEIVERGVVVPDLVLTDIKMPHLDGIELGRAVAQLRPGLPVAYMSGHGSVATELLSADLLQNCFIAKPFSPEDLVALVRRCLESAQAQSYP